MAAFRLELLEEAKFFLQSLPIQAYKKILYNVDRVAGGEKNKELFKKLENSDIWEFHQENAKDTEKGDFEGRGDNETILRTQK